MKTGPDIHNTQSHSHFLKKKNGPHFPAWNPPAIYTRLDSTSLHSCCLFSFPFLLFPSFYLWLSSHVELSQPLENDPKWKPEQQTQHTFKREQKEKRNLCPWAHFRQRVTWLWHRKTPCLNFVWSISNVAAFLFSLLLRPSFLPSFLPMIKDGL